MVHLPKRAAQMDYYSILKLPSTCTTHEIKTAYRKQALIHHPDKNANDDEASARFQAINEAYEILTDHETRRAYNKIKGFRHAKSDAAIPMTEKWARHQMYWGQGQTKKTFTSKPNLFEQEFREDCWVDAQNIADHFAYLRLPTAYEGQALQKASLLHGTSSLRYEFMAPALTSKDFFDDSERENEKAETGRDLEQGH